MKVENIREVKARLSRIVADLPESGSVVITKNGRACAVLMPVTDDTDLEVVAISQSRGFWKLFDHATAEANKKGWTSLDDLRAVKKRPAQRRRRKGS